MIMTGRLKFRMHLSFDSMFWITAVIFKIASQEIAFVCDICSRISSRNYEIDASVHGCQRRKKYQSG